MNGFVSCLQLVCHHSLHSVFPPKLCLGGNKGFFLFLKSAKVVEQIILRD